MGGTDRIETLYKITESLGIKYDISRKSPEVPVKPSPKLVRKERACALTAPYRIRLRWTE